jgi:hypothetical protein
MACSKKVLSELNVDIWHVNFQGWIEKESPLMWTDAVFVCFMMCG